MQRIAKEAHEYDAQIAKGHEAASLLANTLLSSTLEKLEADAIAKLIDSAKPEDREAAWHKVRAVREFRRDLESLNTTGKIAKQKKDALKGSL